MTPKRLLCALLAATGIALCAGVALPEVLGRSDVAPYVKPQRLVDVGGHKLNLYCIGRGSPAVILDAGLGDTIASWRKVQPQIAKFTRVCSFDRAGMGFSEAGPLPRDANAMVRDLHALVRRAGIPPPYVLVGHSIAGLYLPLYADRFAQDVAGMVLVDPSFPGQFRVLEAASPAMKRMDAQAPGAYALCYAAAMRGQLGLEHGSERYAVCGFPPDAGLTLRAQCAKNGPSWCALQQATDAQVRRPAFWSMLGSENRAAQTIDSAEDRSAQRSFGAMPLIVLTAANDIGNPPLPRSELRAVERAWTAGHDRVAHASSAGVNFVVTHTQHYIQLDRPGVVTGAVAEVVSQVRH